MVLVFRVTQDLYPRESEEMIQMPLLEPSGLLAQKPLSHALLGLGFRVWGLRSRV